MALVGLFLRVLIPPGFMLEAPDAGLGTKIVICTGSGSLTALDLDGTHDDGSAPAKHRAGEVCSFANVTPLAASPVFAVQPAELTHAIVEAHEPGTTVPASRPDLTLRGPRAPPFGAAAPVISKARTTV